MKVLIKAINILTAIVELILGFRFLLRLFGANTDAPFVRWVYDTSMPLLYPFRGIFPTEILNQRYSFEFATLFAMITYSLFAFLIIELVRYVRDWSSKKNHHHE